ncbi:MAG TPA: tetratricopeptide repeat protein [Kofleriaceae bacterium]|nr:tetratricopeptide repeat protein [Kofleriaceae bacterium]
MTRLVMFVCALLLVPSLAFAETPTTADGWYKLGETEYNLGNFEKAADAFKQGYALETIESKKPAYLYNVAQAYRQGKDCKNAIFFYKRFIDLKEADRVKPLTPEKRTEVEGFISVLDECAKKQEQISNKQPTGTDPPGSGADPRGSDTGSASGSGKRIAGSNDDDGSDDGSNAITRPAPGAPRVISLRVIGGGSKISTGDLPVPIQITGALIGGYPLAINKQLTLEFGAAFTYTPVPFENEMTHENKSASFITVLANVGASYEVIPKLALRGDVGVGALIFSGLDDMGNPFTDMGNPTSGALGMLNVRLGASVEYAITPNVVAIVPLAFSYSPPKSGLKSSITSITQFDFMVGLGYRM